MNWATKTGNIIVLCKRIGMHKAPLLWVGAFVMGKGDGMSLYNMVHRLAKMAGYKIEERIVLTDMQTGKEYR